MPVIKLIENRCNIKLEDRTEKILRKQLGSLNNEQYREIYNDIYRKTKMNIFHKLFSLFKK